MVISFFLYSIPLLRLCLVMPQSDLRSLLPSVPADPPPMALLDPRHLVRQLPGHPFRLAMSTLSLKVSLLDYFIDLILAILSRLNFGRRMKCVCNMIGKKLG